MIISRVFGGVGNQLFIFATSYALAKNTNQELIFDYISGFKKDKIYHRKIDLFYFEGIRKIITTPNAWFFKRFGVMIRFVIRYSSYWKPFFGVYYINDQNFRRYSIEELTKARLIYLDGYFQDISFFQEYMGDIKEICNAGLKFKNNIIHEREERGFVTICLHIRSYEDVPIEHRSENLVLNTAYYSKTIKYVEGHIKDPYFFIFSDNIERAKKMNLSAKNIEFIENNNESLPAHIKDLQLMTSCSHFIIANSTFSWWAAFLGCRKDKIVIRSAGDFYIQSSNFYIENWIAI